MYKALELARELKFSISFSLYLGLREGFFAPGEAHFCALLQFRLTLSEKRKRIKKKMKSTLLIRIIEVCVHVVIREEEVLPWELEGKFFIVAMRYRKGHLRSESCIIFYILFRRSVNCGRVAYIHIYACNGPRRTLNTHTHTHTLLMLIAALMANSLPLARETMRAGFSRITRSSLNSTFRHGCGR